jgi:hypothetical protein
MAFHKEVFGLLFSISAAFLIELREEERKNSRVAFERKT